MKQDKKIMENNKKEVNVTKQPISEVNATKQPNSEVNATKQPNSEINVTKQPISEVNVTKQPISEVNVTKQPNSEVNVTKQPINNEEVLLHIYDISNGMASLMSESLLGFKLDGIWHTSIEVFNKEYYFQNNLKIDDVGKTSFGISNEKLSLGFTDCTEEALNQYIEFSKHTWRPETYDLFENNCNHFTNMLSSFLVNKEIPAYILDLKKIKDTDFFKNCFKNFNFDK